MFTLVVKCLRILSNTAKCIRLIYNFNFIFQNIVLVKTQRVAVGAHTTGATSEYTGVSWIGLAA